jgi:hypothetical protein
MKDWDGNWDADDWIKIIMAITASIILIRWLW